jgi:hypothetical protein
LWLGSVIVVDNRTVAEVRVAQVLPGPVHQAEKCWYHTDRWPVWVDQLARVIEVRGDWPKVGSEVIWESGPAGRGRVRESVVAYEPRTGQTTEVEDDTITGRQTVKFTPSGDEVLVELSLEYKITRRDPLTPVIDLLFIRRLMAGSLRSTLGRFGTELAASRSAGVG